MRGRSADGMSIADSLPDRIGEIRRLGGGGRGGVSRESRIAQLRRARSSVPERAEAEGPNTRFSDQEKAAAGNWEVSGWEGRREREKQHDLGRGRRSYSPPKRRRARARALPDAAVAVSRCGLAARFFTFYIN